MQDLRTSVGDILEKFSQEVGLILDDTIQEVAKEARKEVAASSPGSGKYAKGWRVENTGTRIAPGSTIYNARPGLPHLLEFGHALRGGGRTTAQPHVAPVNDQLAEKIEDKIRRALE